MLAAIVALVIAILGGLTWLWTLHGNVQLHSMQINRLDRDDAELKADQRTLRDGHVRIDTTVELMQARLASLDQIPAIAATVRTIEATTTELKQQMIPREALEQRFKSIEERLK